MNTPLLIALAAGGYMLSRAMGQQTGSSSYTEQRNGMRYFTAETKNRIMNSLGGWKLVPVAGQELGPLPAASAALFELLRGSASSVAGDQAAAMAAKQGKVVLVSATMGAALDGLTQERQFMLFCVPTVKSQVASPVSPFAILLDA